jgi:rare lipoprotein A
MAAALSSGLRVMALLGMVFLAGCGVLGRNRQDGAPLRRLDPDSIKDAVPRRDPITAAGNKNPYTVLGKTYQLLPSSRGYRARGTASWYGTKFHGESTSNGERYDLYAMTAAHCTLPIPTYVQVTNLENHRQAIVRVNDRGPFVNDRLIDLSYAAAVKLGYAQKGTALVEVVAIDVDNWPPSKALVESPPPPRIIAPPPKGVAPAPASALPGQSPPGQAEVVQGGDKHGHFYIQVGAFKSRIAAEALQQRLAASTRYPVVLQMATAPAPYRVRVGPLASREDAEKLRAQLTGQIGGASIIDELAPAP